MPFGLAKFSGALDIAQVPVETPVTGRDFLDDGASDNHAARELVENEQFREFEHPLRRIPHDEVFRPNLRAFVPPCLRACRVYPKPLPDDLRRTRSILDGLDPAKDQFRIR